MKLIGAILAVTGAVVFVGAMLVGWAFNLSALFDATGLGEVIARTIGVFVPFLGAIFGFFW